MDGDMNYVGIDLDPGPCGVVGQVINFGLDQDREYVLSASWAQFLEDLADELEAGSFLIDLDDEFGESDWFLMRKPRNGNLSRNYKAWSQAKLAPTPTSG
jgi:hypothetical protein